MGDIKITFNSGFEDIGENLIKARQENEEKKKESLFDKYQRERKEKRRERKQREKEKKEIDEQIQYQKPVEGDKNKSKKRQKLANIISKDAAKADELDLLVNSNIVTEEFKPNPKDKRFKAIYENSAYNMDPTNKDYSKIGKTFIHEQAKRRRFNE